jgi:hypothetical protein
MGIIGLPVAFLALTFILLLTITIYRSVFKQSKGISKDSAEEIALRRFRNGRPIGAGFRKEKDLLIWEFEVMEGVDVYSIWVDALTGKVVKAQNIRSGRPYVQSSARMLGKRIG